MKKLMNKIDRFCYKHPNFGIENLMLYIVIGNAVVWLFSMMDTTYSLTSWLTFSPYYILQGQVWRLFTFALIPNTSGFFTLIMLYFYYFIGSTMEQYWGRAKFNIYFLSGIVLTIIYGFIIYFATGTSYSVDAQFIYLSMFFSFATLHAETQVLLFFIIPIKIKWIAIVDAVFFVISIVTLPFPHNLLPVVAVANYLIFCGSGFFSYFSKNKRQQRKNTVNFKNEVRRIQYEQRTQPYSRRCEVCGRTDVSNPELEFRYCSRCQGYHCFCIDHINDHTHRSE